MQKFKNMSMNLFTSIKWKIIITWTSIYSDSICWQIHVQKIYFYLPIP